MSVDGARRSQILQIAGDLVASSGLRTSVAEIAEACGILPGSLYHHFESKDAILVELIARFRAELDSIAERRQAELTATTDPPGLDDVISLANELAACAMRHRAALLLTFYEPPTSAGDELVQAARRIPMAIESAVLETFRRGQDGGFIRPEVDVAVLTDRFCQAMLHIGLGVLGDVPGADRVPEVRCRIMFEGIATGWPSARQLDRSRAMAAARRTVESWSEADGEDDERLSELRAAARSEFGRRGFESTTVRDIAAAAGLSTGSVYRLVGSKDELLASIMGSFVDRARSAWSSVLAADSSPLQRIDALMWVNINLVDRFTDEYNIQLAWLRESPPESANLGRTFAARLRDLESLVREGTRSGELHVDGPNAGLRAWSLFELLWVPEGVLRATTPAGAHHLARETIIRGVAVRS